MTPLPYHIKVHDYFKKEKKTWDFFAATNTREDQLRKFKTDLLKNTYKFDPATDIELYAKVNLAKEKLFLQLPVTLYQAQYSDEVNASIVFLNNEVHIVFSGKIIQTLNPEELLGVIAHELTHVKLYTMIDGEIEITDRIIATIANDANSEPVYYETARLFRLYTEIFCDRGAYEVLGSLEPIITGLIKTATGLENVNAASYLKQADEIFIADKSFSSETLSHPENFIRARALDLWHQKKELAEAEITTMIEGLINLDKLDIFQQQELTHLTKYILDLLLKPKWFQTTMTLSLAKQYFSNFHPDEKRVLDEKLLLSITEFHAGVKDYLCYLLIDFALVDISLEEVPLGWCLQFAEDLGLKENFEIVLKKEFKLTDKKLQAFKSKHLEAYHQVKEDEHEQIYNG